MPKLCNNMYSNYCEEDFDYYYPYSFHNEDMDYLFSINPCRFEIPLGNNYEIPIKLDNYIVVRDSDIIYQHSGEHPTENTEAEIGTKAYNIVDLVSWELISINPNNNSYNWEQDITFIFPKDADKVIELPEEYYTGKTLNISIFNFRYELIYSCEQEAHKEFCFNITRELSKEYFNFKGLYFLQVDLIDEDKEEITTVISPSNFIIAII